MLPSQLPPSRLPLLQGEVSRFTIERKLELSTLNDHYLVAETKEKKSKNKKRFIIKSYAKKAAFEREIRVYQQIYQNDSFLKTHFVEGGHYLTNPDQEVFYTVCQYYSSGNLFNFLMVLNKKMSEKCCRYFLFCILNCLAKTQKVLGVTHCSINLQNILVSNEKFPVVVGWSNENLRKTEEEVIYDCIDVFCSMLTGCPPLKKTPTQVFLSPVQWKRYEKNLQKLMSKALEPENYRVLTSFLELTLVNPKKPTLSQPKEKQNKLTLEQVLAHPYLSTPPNPSEVSSELQELQKKYLLKEQQKIKQDMLKKAKRQQIILQHQNNLNDEALNSSSDSSLCSDYDSFNQELELALSKQGNSKIGYLTEEQEDPELLSFYQQIKEAVEKPISESRYRGQMMMGNKPLNNSLIQTQELRKQALETIIQKKEKKEQQQQKYIARGFLQQIKGCFSKKSQPQPMITKKGLKMSIQLSKQQQKAQQIFQNSKKSERGMEKAPFESAPNRKTHVQKQIIIKLNIVSFCLANLKFSLRELVDSKTLFLSEFLLEYFAVEKLRVHECMMEANLNLQLFEEEDDVEKQQSKKIIHPVSLHIAINFTLYKQTPQEITSTQVDVKQSRLHEFHNMQIMEFVKKELTLQPIFRIYN